MIRKLPRHHQTHPTTTRRGVLAALFQNQVHMIPSTKKSGALLATALLIGSSINTFAGDGKPDGKIMLEKKPDANPLSFLDGKVVFDFQERFRWEIRNNNFDFNDGVNSVTDDNWFLQRARLGLAIKPTPWLKIYAQAQDSREINSDRPDFPGALGAEGDDSFDLRQGYFEIGNAKEFPLTLKAGRQTLVYGDERLIGASDWNNLGRTFDAVKLRWEEKAWSLDAFASSVVVFERGSYNQSDFFNGNETGREQIFSGLYFSTTALGPQTTDLYVLHLHENANPHFAQNPLGDTNFLTLGLRVKSKPGAFAHSAPEPMGKGPSDGKSTPPPPVPPKPVGFDYDGEFAFQTGDVKGRDLTAFAAHVGTGYTFDIPWTPRLGAEYNFASGDSDPLDREVETFQNLFPTNHKFYGYADFFSWQNIHDAAISLKAQPVKKVTTQLDYHAFWLANTDDSWYRANGVATVRPLTPAARAADNYVGSEIDFTVTWNVRKEVAIQAGYSHFFAGSYLGETGAQDDADFGYLQATVTF